MQVAFAETDHDLLDHFAVVVDQDAEPADLNEALAEFLLKIVTSDASPIRRRDPIAPMKKSPARLQRPG